MDRTKLASLCLAFLSTSSTLATLGKSAQILWRVAFAWFCLVQIALRAVTLCALVLLTKEHCSSRYCMRDRLCYCDEHTWPWIIVAYGMLTMITSMLCHVVHLQGHAGGSIRSCVYYQHEELLDTSSTKGAKRHSRPKVRPELTFACTLSNPRSGNALRGIHLLRSGAHGVDHVHWAADHLQQEDRLGMGAGDPQHVGCD